MKLVIVESPTKAHTIERFLGQEYRVLSSYGHIRDLPKGELGIDIENNFKPKYVIPTKARKNVNILKKESQKADITILATDEDREGEAIAYHLAQVLQLGKFQAPNTKFQINPKSKIQNPKSYTRIVFHEITKKAIEEALKNPRKIDMNLVDAQQARRTLDRLVGYKLSPFLWKKIARGLSAGRVQSVAVRLVVGREREIENFTPQEYWSIEALLKKIPNPNGQISTKSQIPNSKLHINEFKATLAKKNEKVIPKLGIKTKEEADKILDDLGNAEYRVEKVEKKEIKRNPLPPFTTSTLQQESWKRFHLTARFTMRIAQQLYERGFITYHRSDSLNLSELSLSGAEKFIIENYGKEYWAGFRRRYKTKAKTAQEAHEAIRPTEPGRIPDGLKNQAKLDSNQYRLYNLIWRRFIASQMAQARFDSTTVEIETQNPKSQIPKYIFKSNGQTLKFDGFLKIYPIKFEENELPILEKDEIPKLLDLLPSQHFTQPPARFTEATLIKELEKNGIGRPSTYAPTLSTIQERNYIGKNENKRFYPTEVGQVVDNLLVKNFPEIVDIKFTAEMEDSLDKVARGETKWPNIIKKFYVPFSNTLKKKEKEVPDKKIFQEKTEKICPRCGAKLVIKFGRFGKFYACSNFPKCRYTEPLEKKILGVKCPKCKKGELVEKKTKKGKIFYGCSRWPKCDFALWDKPTGEKCPKCGSLLVETKKGVKCSNKKCDFKQTDE